MPDEFDIAQQREEQHRAAAVRAIAPVGGAGCEDCIGCGDPIPAKRRRALPSATRCIDCQHLFERSG